MARPMPSPPWARVGLESAWRKRSKTWGRKSGSMPAPSSRTSSRTRSGRRRTRTSTRPPAGVNLMALARRFQTTCWRRAGSPRTAPAPSSMSISRTIPLAVAAGRTVSTAASTAAPRSVSRTSRLSLPRTMRATSSRSSTIWAWVVALRSMASMARSVAEASSRPVRSSLDQPRTAFSGVRSSWETVAMNSSLARLARSASARASCSRESSAARSASLRRASVRSPKTRATPCASLPSARMGAAEPSMGYSLAPGARSVTPAPSGVGPPLASAAATGSGTGRRCSSTARNTSPRGRPTASGPAPTSFSAAAFTRVTVPRTSVAITASPMDASVVRSHSRCLRSVSSARNRSASMSPSASAFQ